MLIQNMQTGAGVHALESNDRYCCLAPTYRGEAASKMNAHSTSLLVWRGSRQMRLTCHAYD
jgi:hypothetical protein